MSRRKESTNKIFLIVGIVFILGIILISGLILSKTNLTFKDRAALPDGLVGRQSISNLRGRCKTKNSSQFVLYGNDISLPSDSGGQPQACQRKSIEKLGSGSQPDWSWDGKLIAFADKVNGNYEIFVMNADGSARRCLTCNCSACLIPSEFKNKHKGKPTFYPADSRYLLLGVENEYGNHGLTTNPGIGDNYDLWLADLQQNRYQRLTRLPKDSAIQYPRFSSDGKKLLWGQRYEKEKGAIWRFGCEWGFWKLQLADFVINQGNPTLINIINLEPVGKGYYEPHGFLPGDDTKIIMTAQTNSGKSAFYLDIYTYDLLNKRLTKLVSTDNIHYEMAVYSPNGQKISYMAGPYVGFLRGPHKTDLYLMDANSQNRVRLTYFNDPKSKDYVGATVQIQKEAWSPDGTQLISAYYNHKTKENVLFKIDFNGQCGK